MTNEEKKRIWIEERMAPFKFAVCPRCGSILKTKLEKDVCDYCGCTEAISIDREERHRLLEREFDASASDNWDEVDAYREYLAKKYAFPDERFDRKLYDERLEADAKEYEQMLKEREIAAAKLEYMKAHPKCPACGSDNVRKGVTSRGFNAMGASIGGFFAGTTGALEGGMSGGEEVFSLCLTCGHRWNVHKIW